MNLINKIFFYKKFPFNGRIWIYNLMFLLVLVPFSMMALFDGSGNSSFFWSMFKGIANILMFPNYILVKLFDGLYSGFYSLIPTLILYSLIIERLISIFFNKVAK